MSRPFSSKASPELIALRRKGDAARGARAWSDAATFYRAYLAERPVDAAIWVQLGHMSKEAGDYQSAEKAYNEALRLRPDDADIHLNQGHLFKVAGDLGGARAAYRRSFAINGNTDAQRELESLRDKLRDEAEDDPPLTSELSPLKKGRPNVGVIDHVSGIEIVGWAIDPDHPDAPAEIEFRVGKKVVGGAATSLFRPDVAMLGLGRSHAGFGATLRLSRTNRAIVPVHAYLRRTGEELGNSPFETTGFTPFLGPSDGDPVTSARFAFAKRFVPRDGAETALFVTHAPDGSLKPHVPPYARALRDNGIDVLLIVVADRPFRLTPEEEHLFAGVIVRENVGYDFAAWAHAMRLVPEVLASPILYLVNDSLFGPNRPQAFTDIIERVRATPADLVGLTDNHEHGWHIQSFFLALKSTVLSSPAIQHFFRSIVNLPHKQAVIDNYEVKLAPLVEANGFKAMALFHVGHPLNPTMFAWKKLIEIGFPFVKTLLFRQASYLFDYKEWDRFLDQHGFDVETLKETLEHQGMSGKAAENFPLLAMPADDSISPDALLKVAFIGPWNYDNGLGFASRGIAAAIRATGCRLNLLPVKKPFHIHRPLSPPYDILDFEGPADIVVVHLNPDSWHLLTDEQRACVRSARRRIGYWVWEMSHIPEGWRAEFSSVDAIWAPSRYCADLFDLQAEAPAAVIPHVVGLPHEQASSQAIDALKGRLGIVDDRPIILFVFDGSSYLIRKNPAALIRAFAASGLGARGWTLVLKAKHLFDRPEEGAALTRLAESVPHVTLLNQSLSSDDLATLMDAASVYASPHSSEGFGLTIAEAMAAGKIVVATDYSGSRDFLDAESGLPVAAEVYDLEEDFGHYTKGGRWARIDEAALASALVEAADKHEQGDRTLNVEARRQIGQRLSVAAIAKLIDASFRAVLADRTPRWPQPARLETMLSAGRPVAVADLGPNVVYAPLLPGSLIPKSGNWLDLVQDAADRWLLVAPEDVRIDPHFRSVFMPYAAARPDVAIFYADDVAAGEASLGDQVRLKPDFNLTLFLAQDYIGTPLFVRGSALHKLAGLRSELGEAALTDLLLRAWSAGLSISRVPFVLAAHPGRRPRVTAAARAELFAAETRLRGLRFDPGLAKDTLTISRSDDDGYPPVTIVIPTRRSLMPGQSRSYVEELLDRIEYTDWPADRLRVIVGDDIDGSAEWTSKARPYVLTRIVTPRAADQSFNYAAKMNLLWREATTEHIVLMNDDVRPVNTGWLKALMTFASSSDVGAVGPLLRYENGSIQHAGMVGGLLGLCAHAWLYRRSPQNTYQDWALVQREWSIITGAVVATRRSIMEMLDGFDERFALEFNDVDLCLRMRTAGLRIIYTPAAEMVHAEKASRGETAPPPADLALFVRRWRDWLANDPAFHPAMRRDRFDLQPNYLPSDWFAN